MSIFRSMINYTPLKYRHPIKIEECIMLPFPYMMLQRLLGTTIFMFYEDGAKFRCIVSVLVSGYWVRDLRLEKGHVASTDWIGN